MKSMKVKPSPYTQVYLTDDEMLLIITALIRYETELTKAKQKKLSSKVSKIILHLEEVLQ